MAQLAIAVGGAVVGGLIGMPFGGAMMGMAMGWFVGSTAGSLLFPQHQKAIKSGQIGDNAIQVSTYGVTIPRIYGASRLAGNLIWADKRKEHKHTKKSGGKGMGSGQKTITYTYTQSFAFGICQGPIDGIRKIWADGKLIYERDYTHATDSDPTNDLGGSFAPWLYLGTDDQQPCPIIEAVMGVGKVPGYRNLVYMVADSFNLTDWGNRIPNFTFEVVRGEKALPPPNIIVPSTVAARSIEPYGGLWWTANSTTLYGINPYTLEVVNTVDLGGDSTILETKWWAPGPPSGEPVEIVTTANPSITNISYFGFAPPLLDPITGKELVPPRVYVWANGYLGQEGYEFRHEGDWSRSFFKTYYCVMAAVNARTGALLGKYGILADDVSLLYWLTGPGEIVNQTLYMYQGDTALTYNTAITLDLSAIAPLYLGASNNVAGVDSWFKDGTLKLPKPDGTEGPYYLMTGVGPTGTEQSSMTLMSTPENVLLDSILFPSNIIMVCWDYVHQVLYCCLSQTEPDTIRAYSIDTGKFVELGTLTVTVTGGHGISGLMYEPLSNQLVVIDDPYVVAFDANWQSSGHTGQLYSYSSTVPVVPRRDAGSLVYVPECNQWGLAITAAGIPSVHYATRMWIDLHITQDTMTLDVCVADACSLTNLAYSDIEVSTLSDQIVYGYVMTNQAACRSMIEDWIGAYFFDIVQSDDRIKFLLRPQDKVADLTLDDLVVAEGSTGTASGENNAVISIKDTKENDLPREIDFIHIDPDILYQQNCSRSRRLTTRSRNTRQSNIPLVFHAGIAANVAEKMMTATWAERRQYGFTLSQQWSWLDPGDVVTLTTDELIHTVRLTKVAIQPGNVLQCEAVSMQALAYQHSQPGPDGPVTSDPVVSVALASTVLYLLDTPLLRDADEGSGIYMAVGHGIGAWTGAGAFKSADDANYDLVETFNTEGPVGATGGVLGTVADPYLWDNGPALRIKLTDSAEELSSTTDDEVLNGANAMLVGDEIIQYRDAALQSDGSYLLSRRLRGRRGTEWAMASHKIGERVVALGAGWLVRDVLELSERNQLRYYKGVTFNATLQNADAIPFTYQANCLKPYSPCHIEGSRDGSNNLTITWVRRTRLAGAWNDYVDVPLGETIEAYQIDIMDGTTPVRVLASSRSTVMYLAAQQSTDGFTPGQPITVNVYQLSALVGRGFVGAASV